MENTKRYAMVIDQRRCGGCHSCAVGCKMENNMPDQISLNVVLTEGSTEIDNPVATTAYTNVCDMAAYTRAAGTPRNDFYTRACQHCKDAPCVPVCPVNATHQREDGIVTVDIEKCNGCESCMNACLYGRDEMRRLIRHTDSILEFATGSQYADETKLNTVKKCTFCAHRVDQGDKPFCVEVCPARARYFGDINNVGSDVYRLVHESGRSVTIASKLGTNIAEHSPAVYFLKP
jgi:molybdopterin-containing oxidoreductase family iron-sulfur binding subunit